MFEIKHTLCPSCSVGCGINVILDNGEVVGTFPFKRHPINEGKNCLNGRSSTDIMKNKLTFDSKLLDDVVEKLKSCNKDKVTVVFSGSNSNEDLEVIKGLCDAQGFNILAYADNLKNFDSVVTYDDVEKAEKIFIIGNILYENALLGRRIVHAKKNGAKIFVNDTLENTPTANIADEFTSTSVKEFLEANKLNIDDNSIIIFNKVDFFEDLDVIEATFSKLLPVYSKSNTKGALNIVDAISKEDALELLNNTEVLLNFNDDIINDFDFDFKSIPQVITFAVAENDTTRISDIAIPIKSWLETDGTFTNAEGLTQDFMAVCESDNMSIGEIINRLNG